MVDILEQHQGVVTQFQGDAILATFNVPVSDPKHATNAILAACDMLDQVAQSDYGGQTLKVRIGINSGSVFAGAIGAEGRLNYTVHGDAVNLAFRLEALTREFDKPVLVSGDFLVSWEAGRAFCDSCGPRQVKGRAEPVEVFTVERTPD